jgi:hypothetical protein
MNEEWLAASSDQPPVPPHVRDAGKAVLWLCYAFPLAIYAAIVLLVPIDVLDQVPWAKIAADGIHHWLLSRWPVFDIYTHARTTAFPQIAMLASALGACIAALMALAMALNSSFFFRHIRAAHASRPAPSAKERFGGMVMLPAFGLFCFWAFYCLKGDPSFATGLTTHSRLGYIFVSSLSIALAGIGFGTWPMQVRLFLFDIFSRGKS